MNAILISIGSSVIALLLSIVAFFLVRLINKIDMMNENINNINVKIGIYDTQIQSLDIKTNEIETNLEEMKDKFNDLNQTVITIKTEHQLKTCKLRN